MRTGTPMARISSLLEPNPKPKVKVLKEKRQFVDIYEIVPACSNHPNREAFDDYYHLCDECWR